MSEYIHKSHNVTAFLYHIVFPAKYRRAVIDEEVDEKLKDVCLEIEKRYEMKFLEIGTESDHVHFLVQSVSYVLGNEGGEDDKEPNCAGNFPCVSAGEKAVVGRGVLE